MGEQVLDLRATGAALRRRLGAIALVGVVGAVLGAGVPLLRPPMYTSSSEVLLPTPVVVQNRAPDPDTQVAIASSQAVLGQAGKAVTPALSFRDLGRRIKVSAPSDQTLAFKASAPTAADAEALATAAAKSEVAYVAAASSQSEDKGLTSLLHTLAQNVDQLHLSMRSAKGAESPQSAALSAQLATLTGQLQTLTTSITPSTGAATIIQPASPAARPGFVGTYIVPVGGGLLAGLLLASALVLIGARIDRRLRSRDQLAAAVGRPVIASLAGKAARSIGGWHHLLAAYEPSPVDAWALRQVLRRVPAGADGRRTVTIVGLENDTRGMALGPLIAAYAASGGVTTELVLGDAPHSLGMATAMRRAAGTDVRPGLRISDGKPSTDADLTVVVTVVSGVPAAANVLGEGHGPVLLGLSPGVATAKQVARAAMAGDDHGEVVGVVVVDPDSGDRTPGRLHSHDHRSARPSHLLGIGEERKAVRS